MVEGQVIVVTGALGALGTRHVGLVDRSGFLAHLDRAGQRAPVALVDAFPTLRGDLQETEFSDGQLVSCDEIVDVIATERGSQEMQRDFAKSGNHFLWKSALGLEEAIRRMIALVPHREVAGVNLEDGAPRLARRGDGKGVWQHVHGQHAGRPWPV